MSDFDGEHQSPKRCLARSYRLSRDRWKSKALQRRGEIRVLKARLNDLQDSRDLWKQKSLHLQALASVDPSPSKPNAPAPLDESVSSSKKN